LTCPPLDQDPAGAATATVATEPVKLTVHVDAGAVVATAAGEPPTPCATDPAGAAVDTVAGDPPSDTCHDPAGAATVTAAGLPVTPADQLPGGAATATVATAPAINATTAPATAAVATVEGLPVTAACTVPDGAAVVDAAGEPVTDDPPLPASLNATVPIAHWSPEFAPVHDEVSEPLLLFLYAIQTSLRELPFTALASRVNPVGAVTVAEFPKSVNTATRYSFAAVEEYVGEPVVVALPDRVPALPSSDAAVVLPAARPDTSCTSRPIAPGPPDTATVTEADGVAGTS
jgi:hypothetical protein